MWRWPASVPALHLSRCSIPQAQVEYRLNELGQLARRGFCATWVRLRLQAVSGQACIACMVSQGRQHSGGTWRTEAEAAHAAWDLFFKLQGKTAPNPPPLTYQKSPAVRAQQHVRSPVWTDHAFQCTYACSALCCCSCVSEAQSLRIWWYAGR